MTKSTSYQNYLIESLKEPSEAAGYLNAALEGGDLQVFLLALQNVVKAQGGVADIAKKANKSRTSLYKTLSSRGNPHLQNTQEILSSIGLTLKVTSRSSQQ